MILSRCWHPLVQYIEERFQQFLQAETRINRLGSSHCDNDDDDDNDNDNVQVKQPRTTESTPSSTSSRQQDMDSGSRSGSGVGGYVASLNERERHVFKSLIGSHMKT